MSATTNHNLTNSRANLRAQRHLQTQQMHRPVIPLPKTPESQTLPERNPKVVKCFQTFQWKYDIDAHSPRWKKWFFHLVYLPFVRFAWHRMGIALPEAIVLPNANLPNGAFLVKDWQGCFSSRWRAEQEAARHLHGGYTEVAFEWSETAATVTDSRSICTASSIDKKQHRKRNWEFEAALEKLQDTLVQTRPRTEAFPTLRK